MGTIKERLATIENQIKTIIIDMKDFTNDFVTDKEFAPVQKIVYGFVGIVLTGVALAIVGLVIKK